MNWLIFTYYLTVGCTFNHNVVIDGPAGYYSWQAPSNAVETILGLELLAADHFFVSAEVKTQESWLRDVHFSPYFSEYNVKAGFRYGGFEIGFEDDCTHPTLGGNNKDVTLLYGGWYGVYVTFKGSAKLF